MPRKNYSHWLLPDSAVAFGRKMLPLFVSALTDFYSISEETVFFNFTSAWKFKGELFTLLLKLQGQPTMEPVSVRCNIFSFSNPFSDEVEYVVCTSTSIKWVLRVRYPIPLCKHNFLHRNLGTTMCLVISGSVCHLLAIIAFDFFNWNPLAFFTPEIWCPVLKVKSVICLPGGCFIHLRRRLTSRLHSSSKSSFSNTKTLRSFAPFVKQYPTSLSVWKFLCESDSHQCNQLMAADNHPSYIQSKSYMAFGHWNSHNLVC